MRRRLTETAKHHVASCLKKIHRPAALNQPAGHKGTSRIMSTHVSSKVTVAHETRYAPPCRYYKESQFRQE